MKHPLLILLLLWSCGTKTTSSGKTEINANKTPINIEYVKKQLCYQFIFNKGDTIRCPDSTWSIQLKDTSLFLTQSYYGSGYGNGIWVNLIKLEPYSYKILDSLFWCNADDLFKPENIQYNDSLDWFDYIEEGGGTNHYSETKYLIRVENTRMVEMMSIPLYVSDVDPEVSPMTYTSLKVTPIEMNQKRIILKAHFEAGVEQNDESKVQRIKDDMATFEYSDSTKTFIWIKSTNLDFKDLWTGKKTYDAL